MELEIQIAVQVLLFIALLYTIFSVSVTGKMTTFRKWLIIGSSAGILLFADKIRCTIGIGALIVALVTKHFTDKKKRNDRLA